MQENREKHVEHLSLWPVRGMIHLSCWRDCAMPFRISLLLFTVIASSGICRADIVLLRDGTEQEGEIVRQDGEGITLRIRVGGMNGTIQIAHREIAEVKCRTVLADRVTADAEPLKKSAEEIGEPAKAAEAWVVVGEFYKRHPGYSGQARNAFERALNLSPEHPLARAGLGYVKTDKGWALAEKPRPERVPVNDEIVQAPLRKAEPADEVTIGLRKDAALIKRFQDEQQARDVAEREQRRWIPEQAPAYAGYTRDFYSNNFGIPYYTNPCNYVSPAYGYSGGYSSGGFLGSGYGHGSYGSGSSFSTGFRGGNKSFQYRGKFGGRF